MVFYIMDFFFSTQEGAEGSSNSSRSATPLVSNPGTPRSDVADIRNTPPLPNPLLLPRHSQAAAQANAVALAHAQANAAMALAAAQQNKQMHDFPLMIAPSVPPVSKYGQLLAVIEDMGKDIRPTYSGSKSSAERLKRGIVHARILVRECLMECERSART